MYLAIALVALYGAIVTFWAAFLMRENASLAEEALTAKARLKLANDNNAMLVAALGQIQVQIKSTVAARTPR